MRLLLLAAGISGCVPHLTTSGGNNQPGVWTPPDNGWGVTAPPEGLVGEGYGIDEVVPDFLLPDQFGDDVSLWQFYGSVVVMDVSTMWCAPCIDLARTTEDTFEHYQGDGFMYVTVLQETVDNQPPEQSHLVQWADEFGITAPVVADGAKDGTDGAVTGERFPALIVIDRELRVSERVWPADQVLLHDAIEDVL